MTDDSIAERFHAHLDNCRQCRENPFELCAYGLVLIAAAAELVAGGSTVGQVDLEKDPGKVDL